MSAQTLDFEFDSEFLEPDDTQEPETETIDPELRDIKSEDFIEVQPETARAAKYRKKTKHGLNFLIKVFAGSPRTVSDAAAVIYHGPAIAKSVGHLCDTDERARKFVDFVTEDGIDNPYLLTALTVIPLVIQSVRNHEKALEKGGQLSIPLGKTRRIRLPFKFRLRLGKLRNATEDPDFLTAHVFSNPGVREALAKQGISVAWNGRQ